MLTWMDEDIGHAEQGISDELEINGVAVHQLHIGVGKLRESTEALEEAAVFSYGLYHYLFSVHLAGHE